MQETDIAELLIRISVALVMVAFGISQIKSPEGWLHYIPKLVRFIDPLQPSTTMRLHGLGNLGLGLFLLSGLWQPVSICLALTWWITILPFAFWHNWAIGMRDLAIVAALGALLALQ